MPIPGKRERMLFGAHVSVAGGYVKALDYAESVGCECIQIFAKSPRQWRGPAIDSSAARAFREERMRRAFGPVFTHTAYLINLASPDDALWRARILPAGGGLMLAFAEKPRLLPACYVYINALPEPGRG